MGASAMAAILIKRERQLVDHFRGAGATTPGAAKSPDELGVATRLAWERLVQRAVIREAAPGRYYLDEPSWEAQRALRRRMILVMLVIGLAVAALAVATSFR
ncbi:MAG: hypothetical protein KGL38_07260 [Gemmatimonadota bacterium]|nr:hypothetical protein [Gemmatimonadota bacterium]MDE3127787.1 hypothetical protein [Gemmatimonadota bacterium]MDE3172412.1 hypothetical protein [Gemmatimonadota bacterium]MDE3217366.1 hypothetical protein [Gemmatimonadota bacterium]